MSESSIACEAKSASITQQFSCVYPSLCFSRYIMSEQMIAKEPDIFILFVGGWIKREHRYLSRLHEDWHRIVHGTGGLAVGDHAITTFCPAAVDFHWCGSTISAPQPISAHPQELPGGSSRRLPGWAVTNHQIRIVRIEGLPAGSFSISGSERLPAGLVGLGLKHFPHCLCPLRPFTFERSGGL